MRNYRYRRPFPVRRAPAYKAPEPEPCTRCGDLYRWMEPARGVPRECEHCGLVHAGHRPKGQAVDGAEPRLIYRYPHVLQRCVECDRFEPLDTTGEDGRCWYCSLDGERTSYGVLVGAELVTRDGMRLPAADGLVTVEVHDQTSGPDGSRLLNLRAVPDRPRWGTGWAVRTTEGDTRWWLTSWDSSD